KYNMYKVGSGLLTTDSGTVKYEKFDSGGYTGSFNGGKFAMLHEKELVLNKGETKDFLKAIKLVRNMKSWLPKIPSIGIPMLSRGVNSTTSQPVIHMPIHIENMNGTKEGVQNFFDTVNQKMVQKGVV